MIPSRGLVTERPDHPETGPHEAAPHGDPPAASAPETPWPSAPGPRLGPQRSDPGLGQLSIDLGVHHRLASKE
jgi:hypothetical protein